MRAAEREQQWMKRMCRIGEWVDSLEEGQGAQGLEEGRVIDIKILLNGRPSGDTLVVVRAQDKHGRWVGFVGARSAGEAMLAWRQKDAAAGLKWREDLPWQG